MTWAAGPVNRITWCSGLFAAMTGATRIKRACRMWGIGVVFIERDNMEKSNQKIHDFCEEHARWIESKRFFARPTPLNILAQFQPSKSKEPPDAELSPLHSFFHCSMLLWKDQDARAFVCFVNVYFPWARIKPMKALAHDLGINRDTAYDLANRTAESIYWQAQASLKMRDMMTECRVKPRQNSSDTLAFFSV